MLVPETVPLSDAMTLPTDGYNNRARFSEHSPSVRQYQQSPFSSSFSFNERRSSFGTDEFHGKSEADEAFFTHSSQQFGADSDDDMIDGLESKRTSWANSYLDLPPIATRQSRQRSSIGQLHLVHLNDPFFEETTHDPMETPPMTPLLHRAASYLSAIASPLTPRTLPRGHYRHNSSASASCLSPSPSIIEQPVTPKAPRMQPLLPELSTVMLTEGIAFPSMEELLAVAVQTGKDAIDFVTSKVDEYDEQLARDTSSRLTATTVAGADEPYSTLYAIDSTGSIGDIILNTLEATEVSIERIWSWFNDVSAPSLLLHTSGEAVDQKHNRNESHLSVQQPDAS